MGDLFGGGDDDYWVHLKLCTFTHFSKKRGWEGRLAHQKSPSESNKEAKSVWTAVAVKCFRARITSVCFLYLQSLATIIVYYISLFHIILYTPFLTRKFKASSNAANAICLRNLSKKQTLYLSSTQIIFLNSVMGFWGLGGFLAGL